jgi:hypothetical protein
VLCCDETLQSGIAFGLKIGENSCINTYKTSSVLVITVTLRRIRLAIVAVEKQEVLHILSVCL